MPYETINLGFDFVLIFTALWMIFTVRGVGLGGVVGKTLSLITIGAVVLGVAHLLETVTFEVMKMDAGLVEFIHRTVILVGFVLLTIGFSGLAKLKSK